MKILVALKRVSDPENANKVRVSADGKQVTTDGLEWKANPFDEYALEAALRLNENAATKEKLGETIAVTLGPAESTQTLRHALAMGADRGIRVDVTDEELDSFVVARALKAIVDKEKPDLLLLGKQAVDSDANVAGQTVAELLNWPMATLVIEIEGTDGGKSLKAGRAVDTGLLTLELDTPCVMTAADYLVAPKAVRNGVTPADFEYPNQPRYASLKGIMAARKKPIEELKLAELGVDTTPTTNYLSFELPPPRAAGVLVESVDELVQKLQTEAKVL